MYMLMPLFIDFIHAQNIRNMNEILEVKSDT
jgi:hypothetical protein